ncbi:hypothetical protein [Kitasatospora sp. NPDC002040]|uniref:hypothetical protein n=1 Tax=Kitasatospora sp. NPDC002040 TaxID=3154661 RepID=UPI00332E9614
MPVSDGPSLLALVVCENCGRPMLAHEFGARCSWPCYDQPRGDPESDALMIARAPAAFAFFMGLGPGRRVA